MSSNFIKNKHDVKHPFSINFNIEAIQNIDGYDVGFKNLSSSFTMGIFNETF
mgnify:FL=1